METSTQQRTNETVRIAPSSNSNPLASRKARGFALLALTCGLACGCSVIRVYDPQTGKPIYESKRLGNSLKIGAVAAKSGTNSVTIQGYESDQVQAFKAGAEVVTSILSKIP